MNGVRLGHPHREAGTGEIVTPMLLVSGDVARELPSRSERVDWAGRERFEEWYVEGVWDEEGLTAVVYRRLSDDALFARPVSEWLGTVVVEGREVPRFAVVDVASLLAEQADAEEILTEAGVPTVSPYDGRTLTLFGRIESLIEDKAVALSCAQHDSAKVSALTGAIAAHNAEMADGCADRRARKSCYRHEHPSPANSGKRCHDCPLDYTLETP